MATAKGKPNQAALDAMMADLGDTRCEEFAQDANNTGRERSSNIPRNAPAFPQTDDGAAWRAATNEGVFQDYDYHMVSGRDGLQDGNAHRINRAANRTTHEALHQPFQYREVPPPRQYDPMTPSARYRPHVPGPRVPATRPSATRTPDPQVPGPRAPQPSHQHQDHSESSLGGLVPPGGVTKRWDASKGTTSASQPALPAITTRISGVGGGGPRQPPQHSYTGPSQRPSASQVRPAANGTSGQPNETTNNGAAQGQRRSDAAQIILWRQGIRIAVIHTEQETFNGQAYLAQSQDGEITWEFRFANGEAASGYVSQCLSPLVRENIVLFRRRESPMFPIQTSRLEFNDVESAKLFCRQLNSHMKGLAKENEKAPSPEEQHQRVQDQTTRTELDAEPSILVDVREDSQDSPPQPFNRSQSGHPDLEGLEYHVASAGAMPTKPLNLQGTSGVTMPMEDWLMTLQEEKSVDQLEGTPSNALSEHSHPRRFDVMDWDLSTTESAPLGEGLLQCVPRVLQALDHDDYTRMIMECGDHSQSTERCDVPVSVKRLAMQAVLSQLVEEGHFRALERDEQKKAVAVVYANILQAISRARIVRSAEQMINLRSSSHPFPVEVREACLEFPGYASRAKRIGRPTLSLPTNRDREPRLAERSIQVEEPRPVEGSVQVEESNEDPAYFYDVLRWLNESLAIFSRSPDTSDGVPPTTTEAADNQSPSTVSSVADTFARMSLGGDGGH
ncbi:hypothetical protein GGR52DRAFT_589206 [Hypoxylon sp. FL1284]|nr:hypothetical protein GGR52DRAFT_589206 [Hypoxylon sp. FL1284]